MTLVPFYCGAGRGYASPYPPGTRQAEAMNIFEIKPKQAMSEILAIPDTHYYMLWCGVLKEWTVVDSCGFTHHDFTREVRRALKAYNVKTFYAIGYWLQAESKRLAA